MLARAVRFALILLNSVCMGMSLLAVTPCDVTLDSDEPIQEAIDAAPQGAVICLAPGEWIENLVIERGITLRGAGTDASRIYGREPGAPVIHIEGASAIDVSLLDLTVAEALVGDPWTLQADGIRIAGHTNVILDRLAVTANRWCGVIAYDSAEVSITDSSIAKNRLAGIFIFGSAGVTVRRSSIADNRGWGGIYLEGTGRLDLRETTIETNSRGITLAGAAEATIVENRIIANSWHGVALYEEPCFDTTMNFAGYVTGYGNTIPGPGEPQANRGGSACPLQMTMVTTPTGRRAVVRGLIFLMTQGGGELDRRH